DSSQLKSIKSKPVDVRTSSSKRRKKQKVRSEKELIDVPKKRKHYNKFRNMISDQNVKCESALTEEDSKEDSEEDFDVTIDEDSTEDDSQSLNEDEILFERFTAPNIEDFEPETVDTNKIDNS
ncbi:16738_t:CDS:2, partial [Funneliformis caledonium]